MNKDESIEINDIEPTRELSPEEMEHIAGGKGALGAVVAAASAATVFASVSHIEKAMLELSGNPGGSHASVMQKLDKMTAEIYGEDQDDSQTAPAAQTTQPQQAQPTAQTQITRGGAGGTQMDGGFVPKRGDGSDMQTAPAGAAKMGGTEGAVSTE